MELKKERHASLDSRDIPSIDLMEKASKAFVSWFLKEFGNKHQVIIFCGVGNNGGDGLAIARLLHEFGCKSDVFFVGNADKASPDFKINFDRLNEISEPKALNTKSDFPKIDTSTIVIDGIFGSGLTRVVEGFYGELIDYINSSDSHKVIVIDIASGLFSDSHTPGDAIVRCTHTVSFQVPKLAFFLPQCDPYVGDLSVVDIGLDQDFIDGLILQLNIANLLIAGDAVQLEVGTDDHDFEP